MRNCPYFSNIFLIGGPFLAQKSGYFRPGFRCHFFHFFQGLFLSKITSFFCKKVEIDRFLSKKNVFSCFFDTFFDKNHHFQTFFSFLLKILTFSLLTLFLLFSAFVWKFLSFPSKLVISTNFYQKCCKITEILLKMIKFCSNIAYVVKFCLFAVKIDAWDQILMINA